MGKRRAAGEAKTNTQDHNLKETTTMFKKIIVGALLVGVIGVLIAGAVARTNAKAGDGAAGEAGRGRATVSAATAANGGGQRGGRGSQGEQAFVGSGQGVAQADVTAEDWLVVSGTVTSVADDLVEIETDAGAVIPLQGRPLSFAAEQPLHVEGERSGEPQWVRGERRIHGRQGDESERQFVGGAPGR
jgi:hypothetical protein